MGVLPPDFYNNTLSSSVVSKSKTPELLQDYLIDLTTGNLVISDSGQFTVVFGLDAIIVQMWRKLHTKQGVFSIYSSTYGNLLDKLKGKGKSYGDAYASKILTDCLVDRIYVTSVNNVSTTLSQGHYTIDFTVSTIYGDTSEKINIDID